LNGEEQVSGGLHHTSPRGMEVYGEFYGTCAGGMDVGSGR
jgi:hypothetical protein